MNTVWRRLYEFGLLAAIVVLCVLIGFVAMGAETACGRYETMKKRLSAQYEEVLIGRGLDSGGNLLELYRSVKGTWTVMISYSNGLTCMTAAGIDWQEIRFIEPGPQT